MFTWTGFYLGINAGYVFDSSTRFDRTVGFLPNNQAALNTGLRPIAHTVDDDGFTGGGQIGYNYQFGNIGGFGFGGGGGLGSASRPMPPIPISIARTR